ncbi:MAG: sulfatase-like hydrolase/transferase [Planctomycetota bacterium]
MDFNRGYPLSRAIVALTFTVCATGIPFRSATAAPEAAVSKPHVVFILADDLGYGDLGCYGCDEIRTPHLDRLAAEGVRFTDCYANGPVCSPTRAAFLTGRYQQRIPLEDAIYYQEMGRGLPPEGETVADALAAAGYSTALAGKWHLGYDAPRRPNAQGFSLFFGLLGGNHHYFEHMDRSGIADLFLDEEPIELDGYSTDLITEYAIRFLREGARQQPVFLFVSYNAPHFPWQGPNDREKQVKPKHKSWQEGDRATYVAMVESMDAGIGRLLGEVDRLGLRQQTLVVFTSDNGGHTYSRNAPLAQGKATLWEGGIRVPCIARWPGVLPAGEETEQVAITMDWTATFRRLAGVPADADKEDGIDLMPLMTGRAPAMERTLFWRQVPGPVRKKTEEARALRSGRWKLLEQAGEKRYLFDLQEDIGETRNLITKQPAKARELATALDAWETRMAPKLQVQQPGRPSTSEN